MARFREFVVARTLVGHNILPAVHKETAVVAVGMSAAVYTQAEIQAWAAACMLVRKLAVACMLVHKSVVACMLVHNSVVACMLEQGP